MRTRGVAVGVVAALLVICAGASGEEPFGDVAPAWRQPLDSPVPTQRTVNIIRGRSQRIETGHPASNAAVLDPSIASVLPLPSGDLAVAGLAVGTTDVALWGQGDAQPELWRLVVTADPAAPTAEKWDAAKLERRLADLFPGNRIALVPLSHELLVKGDAASADQAAQILGFVRGVVEMSQDLPPSRSIQLVAGARGGQVDEHRADIRVVDRLNVPRQPGLRVGLTVVALDPTRLDALGADLAALFGQRPAEADREPWLLARLEVGEARVLVDWLTEQGAARRVAQATLATRAGRTSRISFPDVDAARSQVDGRGTPVDFTLAVTVRPHEQTGAHLELDAELGTSATRAPSSTGSLRELVRVIHRSRTESELPSGQVLAAVLRSAAAGSAAIQVPLLGELVPPAKPGGPTPATAPDVLIIVAPEGFQPLR